MLKVCSKCHETKELDQFPKSGKLPDGSPRYRSRCKECNKEDCRQYRENNLEKERERGRRYNAENREKQREYAAQYRANNLEQARESTRRWREANREKELESMRERYWSDPESSRKRVKDYYAENRLARLQYARKFREENPDYGREYRQANKDKDRLKVARYRSRKRGLFWHDVSDEYLISRDGLICGWCSCTLPESLEGVHRDHIMPMSLGGPHTHNNLTLACSSCNLRKHAADPLEFATETWVNPSGFVLDQLDWIRMFRYDLTDPVVPA